MSRPPTWVLVNAPSGGEPTVEATQSQITLATATLAGQGGSSIALTSMPALVLAAAGRNSITINNPVDGQTVGIGQVSALGDATEAKLTPGNQFLVKGYNGPVWARAMVGTTTTLFYTVT